jgi:sulfur relay (sulfurtransferase) DsrC/TusE family protein
MSENRDQGCLIILVYREVFFLEYTLSPAVRNLSVMNGFQYGYEEDNPTLS